MCKRKTSNSDFNKYSYRVKPGSPLLQKTPTEEGIISNKYLCIQYLIDLLKEELEKNTVANTEFQRNIEKTVAKSKLNDRDEA